MSEFSLSNLMRLTKHNKTEGQNENFELKVLKKGESHFRVVDTYPVLRYEHWFTAADGVRVRSICSRDRNEEIADPDAPKKYCHICDVVRDAREIYKNSNGEYSEQEVYHAGIIIGEVPDPNLKRKAPWTAKALAFLNVIDRDDNWCEKNDHTKALAKTDKLAGITAAKNGQLEGIIEQIVSEYGDWRDYDIKCKKSGKNLDTKYVFIKKDEYPLTEEELAYETYDFEAMIRPTPQEKLEKWLTVGTKKSSDGKGSDNSKNKKSSDEPVKKKTLSKTKPKPEPEPEPEEVDEEEATEEVEMYACESCKHEIPADSESCPQCGCEFEFEEDEEDEEDVTEEVEEKKPLEKSVKSKPSEKNVEMVECPVCEELIRDDSKACKHCGESFVD